jgi:hypothetical protein
MHHQPVSGVNPIANANATTADSKSDVSQARGAQRVDSYGGAANVLPLQHAASGQTGSIKLAGENDLLSAHFSNPEIQFRGGLQGGDLQWWNDTLIKPHGLPPKELKNVLLRGAHQYMTASNVEMACQIKRNLGQKLVNVTIQLRGDEPQVVHCEMNLDFDFKGKQLTVQSIEIKGAGKGMGTALSSNIEGLAKNLGFREVCLFASKDAGPYFWPRRGYIPTRTAWTTRIAPEIRNCLEKLAEALQISAEVQTEVEKILRDKNPQAITRIAASRQPMVPSSRNPETLIPLGRALLAESGITYDASLRL